MFDEHRRQVVRDRLLELAAQDPAISGAAITGSAALGGQDRWSDIDLAFGVADLDLSAVLDRWTATLTEELAVVHHWDLPAGPWTYRVFLLPDGLELDLGFAADTDWAPTADSWQTVFGSPAAAPDEAATGQPTTPPSTVLGLGWHHVLHARVCIERGRGLQAAYWVGAVRDLATEAACRRLGLPTAYAKGAHLLPRPLADRLAAALVASTEPAELRRALRAASEVLTDELDRLDPAGTARLRPVLDRLSAAEAASARR